MLVAKLYHPYLQLQLAFENYVNYAGSKTNEVTAMATHGLRTM